MSFKWYLILMSLGTGIAWTALVVLIQTVDPFESGFLNLVFFYIDLLLSLIGTFSILGVVYRVAIRKSDQLLIKNVQISFRHSILFALIAVVSLFLSANYLFHWYVLFPLLIVMVFVEYLFLLIQEARR